MDKESIIVFHDILNWNMLKGWDKILKIGLDEGYNGIILRRTTSGIGVLYRNITKRLKMI